MTRFRQLCSSARGFTLIELLVVILIIAILIAVSAPSFLGQTQKAHDSATKQYLNVAYKAAAAYAVDHQPSTGDPSCAMADQGSYCSAAGVAFAIHAAEPELTATTGSCPADAVGQPDTSIFVDTAATTGNNLTICADPNGRVWTLTVVGGALQPFGPVFTGSGGGGGGGSAGSDSSSGSDNSVSDPASGTVTVSHSGSGFDTGWTITDPAPGAGHATTITISVDSGSVPSGADAGNIRVSKNDSVLVSCVGSGAANPNPCVTSVTVNGDGSVTVVIKSNGDSGDVYQLFAPNGITTGDVPLFTDGAPVNDNFSYAKVLSGASGSVDGTLVNATIQTGQTLQESVGACVSNGSGGCTNDGAVPSVDGFAFDDLPSRTAWYVWQAPSDGTLTLDTVGTPPPFGGGSQAPPMIAVWTGTKWPDAGSPSDPAMFTPDFHTTNQRNLNSNQDSQIVIPVTSGDYYVFWVANLTWPNSCGTDCPDQGAFHLNYSVTP